MSRRKLDPDQVVIGEVTATPMRERGERSGRRYWRARTGTGAHRRTVWTGWATREEVEVEVARVISLGIPSSPRSSPEDVRTVGDLLRAWIAAQRVRHAGGEIADRSLVNYKQATRHWISVADDILVERMTRPAVEDQVRSWRAAGVAPRTCRLAVDVLRAAFKWGEDRGHGVAPDLRKLAAVSVRDDEHVNNDETPLRGDVARVIAAIPPGRDRDVVLLLAHTGARVGEVAALQVGDVDRAGGFLLLSGRDLRRRRRGKVEPRRWPITGELGPLLDRLCDGRDREAPLVAELPIDVADLARGVLRTACEAVDVPRFTAHGLRRMVACELLEVANPRQVSELTGHSVAILLRYYARPRVEALRDIVGRAAIGSVEGRGKVIALGSARGTESGHDER